MDKFLREHYTHFLLAHAEEISKFMNENGSDYFGDTNMIENMFEKASNDYIKSVANDVFRIPLSEVIADKWFLNNAIELYEEEKYKDITVEEIIYGATRYKSLDVKNLDNDLDNGKLDMDFTGTNSVFYVNRGGREIFKSECKKEVEGFLKNL